KNDRVNSSEIGEQQAFNGAVFLQNVWQPMELENLNISLGMRYDYHQIFGGKFSPRIGLSYGLQKDLSFHASVAHAYRTPTFNDLYWPEDDYVGGNPNLVPETAWNYEAGIRYIDEKGTTQAELNLFRKNVNNLINWAADSKEVWRPTNIGSARLNGVEVILMKKLNDYLAADLNYTYLDAIDLDLGTQLKPKHKYGLGIAYLNKSGRNEDDLTIGLKGYLVTGRPDNLNNYYLFDANLDRDFTIDREKNRKVKLSLTIKNLFDQKPELVSGYPVQGRTFLLGISTDF
ncbi:MAG TPA: TonB-dependent receptor, partial [Atribacterota bacterium]|nr:TonB-dependent receptor [Atribacterota bacterium]